MAIPISATRCRASAVHILCRRCLWVCRWCPKREKNPAPCMGRHRRATCCRAIRSHIVDQQDFTCVALTAASRRFVVTTRLTLASEIAQPSSASVELDAQSSVSSHTPPEHHCVGDAHRSDTVGATCRRARRFRCHAPLVARRNCMGTPGELSVMDGFLAVIHCRRIAEARGQRQQVSKTTRSDPGFLFYPAFAAMDGRARY